MNSSNEPARIGVIGVGWWATFNHIPVTVEHADAALVALADPDADRVAKTCERFSVPGRYTDFRAMIAQENLDGVIVASPHVAHFENAMTALEAGCHVLVEKPMTTSAGDARALELAATTAGKQILIPCGWNFGAYTNHAADWVTAGRIGTVSHVACQMASALGDLFAGAPMLETADHMYRPPPSTWADPARAGGYGWGQMSHSLAWVFRVAGLDPDQVFCFAGKSPTGVDYYDAAAIRFSSGATMATSGAATVPKHCGFQLDIRIFGSDGMILFDVERDRLELRRNDGADEILDLAAGDCAYDAPAPVLSFIDICNGRPVINQADATVGRKVVETLDALYRSAASNQAETV